MKILNILIFIVLILFTFYFLTTKETFKSTYNCNCGYGCGRFGCQKCNRYPTCYNCPTRNMSYDLRGEAYFQPRTNFPFYNSKYRWLSSS